MTYRHVRGSRWHTETVGFHGSLQFRNAVLERNAFQALAHHVRLVLPKHGSCLDLGFGCHDSTFLGGKQEALGGSEECVCVCANTPHVVGSINLLHHEQARPSFRRSSPLGPSTSVQRHLQHAHTTHTTVTPKPPHSKKLSVLKYGHRAECHYWRPRWWR